MPDTTPPDTLEHTDSPDLAPEPVAEPAPATKEPIANVGGAEKGPSEAPTPNETVPDANDPVDKEIDKAFDEGDHVVSEVDEDIARASNSILDKLTEAKSHIDGLRQKGHQLGGWITEAEGWLHLMLGKIKGVLSGNSAGA